MIGSDPEFVKRVDKAAKRLDGFLLKNADLEIPEQIQEQWGYIAIVVSTFVEINNEFNKDLTKIG